MATGMDEFAEARASANAAVEAAFAAYAEAVSGEESAALTTATDLLANFNGDPTILRERMDEVLRRHELRTQDALETLRSECRRAMLSLALGDTAADPQLVDAP